MLSDQLRDYEFNKFSNCKRKVYITKQQISMVYFYYLIKAFTAFGSNKTFDFYHNSFEVVFI